VCFSAHAQITLRHGGDAAFAPFESLNANGQAEGFQIELMKALGRDVGVEVSISLQAWPALQAVARDNDALRQRRQGGLDVL
jgi:ABC-type amino acid transport substrate-binding protein